MRSLTMTKSRDISSQRRRDQLDEGTLRRVDVRESCEVERGEREARKKEGTGYF